MREQTLQNPLYRYKKLIFIFIIIFLTVLVVISNSKNIELSILEIGSMPFYSIVILFALLVIHLISDACILKIAIDDPSCQFKQALTINMAGCFFANITPLYIGSYPSRLYYLYKENIPMNKTLSALTVRGITYQIALNVFAFIALFATGLIIGPGSTYFPFVVIGFIWNLTITVLLLLISSSYRFNRFAIKFIHKIALWIPFLKKREDGVTEAIDQYYVYTRRIYHDKKYFFSIFFLSVVKLLSIDLMPLVVFYGLGIPIQEYWIIIIGIASLMAIIASVIPTPGGIAASEAAFIILYGLIFAQESTVQAGMLVWRLFSFYSVIIIGLIFTLILQAKQPKWNLIPKKEGSK
ncbi:MAG: lysylphosphatidylglycerol synthase transmembrane domain-containing protein [Bacilli bacterium]|nr:lysylphosphatidylglycerol synthase transmembrane domain-containing protein [Bacilli bacterium]